MKVSTDRWINGAWVSITPLVEADLVIYFGCVSCLKDARIHENLKARYPKAHIMGCSTGGEILGNETFDDTIICTAITFHKTRLKPASVVIESIQDSFAVGQKIAEALNADDLKYVLLLSDGITMNGKKMVEGLYSVFPKTVIVTGGLAGDNLQMKETLVGMNEEPQSQRIVAMGFYGDELHVGYGSYGGWDPFGPNRRVTKSIGNMVYELDGKPALELYKKYLGPEAENLPASALLFPLNIGKDANDTSAVVRTVTGINIEHNSLQFTADIKEGSSAQFMRGDLNSLIEGAARAASLAKIENTNNDDSIAFLVSCVGRKVVLGQNIGDEVEAVAEILGSTPTIGFYAYGEICHKEFTGECDLHNQTMTVTVIHEPE